jgi:OmpA family protein
VPWTCQCSLEQNDDVDACPTCGTTKESWTLQVDKTRVMQISAARTKLECRRGVSAVYLRSGDHGNSDFETASTSVAPALAKSLLRKIAERGDEPAPAHRLIVRVTPRKSSRAVTLTAELEDGDLAELEVDGGHLELSSSGFFDLQVLCVFGPEDVSDLSFPNLHLLDLSQEDAPGYPSSLEVEGVKKSVELEIEPVEDAAPGVELLEVEDICFATGREILLPGGWSRSDDLTGLTVIAAALTHSRHHPDRRLLIAGHTDSVGSVEDNLVLSEDRAQNVHLYLTGQRDAWAAHCEANQDARDVQAVLKWTWWRHEWDCDPGPIDGKWGKGSQRALDRFREQHGEDFGSSLEAGDPATAADWGAFFDVYDLELAAKVMSTPEKLGELRSQAVLCDPPTIGCSEHWPTERPGAPSSKAANRRVDVLYFDAAHAPQASGGKPGESIYGSDAYTRDYLSVDEAFQEPEPPYGNAPFTEKCRIQEVCARRGA